MEISGTKALKALKMPAIYSFSYSGKMNRDFK